MKTMKYLRKKNKTNKTNKTYKTKLKIKGKSKTKSRKIFGGAAMAEDATAVTQFNFNHTGKNENDTGKNKNGNNINNATIHRDYIGEEIIATCQNPLYDKHMECHRAADALDSFIDKHYKQISFNKFKDRNTDDTKKIIEYIKTCVDDSVKDNKHFMLSLQCHGHFFAIEILNGKYRILSSYAGKHSLYDYLTKKSYGYGNFQKLKHGVLFFLSQLSSKNEKRITSAVNVLFQAEATFPNGRITPLTLMTIYELIPK
jgi:hypothetical protein